MALMITIFSSICFTLSWAHPILYDPYYQPIKYTFPHYNDLHGYANNIPYYGPYISPPPPYVPSPYVQNGITQYLSHPYSMPTLNVLAEVPYSVQKKFTVVPIIAVAKESMNVIRNVEIMNFSKNRPMMTVKNDKDQLIQCTPAVKVVLDKPITMYSLESSIVFPAEIEILYRSYRIPIEVGGVLVPIPEDVYVSPDTPVAVTVVYAVPSKPIFNYLNDKDVTTNQDTQAVIVDSDGTAPLPAKNVTVLDFPSVEAEPHFEVDEEDEELVNRNPPVALIPAGIVQSTQPLSHVEPFTNPKESSILTVLREEANRHRLNNQLQQ